MKCDMMSTCANLSLSSAVELNIEFFLSANPKFSILSSIKFETGLVISYVCCSYPI